MEKDISPRIDLRTLCCPRWYLPWSPLVQPRWGIGKKIIQLEITEFCNVSCINCECCFEHAPSGGAMSGEQIRKFVYESIDLGWKWDLIKIRGGEPTLHPLLFHIVESLTIYRDFNPDCRFSIITNNFSDETKRTLSGMPSWITILRKDKKGANDNAVPGHDSINIAPADLFIYKFADFRKGCPRTVHCGMGLSRYGYYPCAPGIHVSRIFGLDVGIKKLSLVNDDAMRRLLGVLCRYCGHYKQPNDHPAKNIVSASWRRAFKKYREERPDLSLY